MDMLSQTIKLCNLSFPKFHFIQIKAGRNVFQMMSKNYSLAQIKSLLETVQDQVFSILLDPSPNSNSRFFQNFTHISLRAFKYLNHYLNVLQRDDKIGGAVSFIYENLHRSFNDYKGRNIYAESYLSTPLAINEEELKQEDEIYHFMNTRNNNIPLGILGNPQLEKERMQLALFVEQMQKKKKITLKEPKRSLQMHQQPLAGLKVTRKTTYDPSFKMGQEDPMNSHAEVQVQTAKMENIEQVQTQTDCLLQEFQTQTEKEDQAKSQAQSCFKSEATVGMEQSIRDQVKKKSKVNIKKKGSKATEGKGIQKKKKAHIASSVKIAQPPGEEKQSRNQIKTQANQDTSMKNQCSIKAICSGVDMQLSSKQVNILYNKNCFQPLSNELEGQKVEQKEDSHQSEKLQEIRQRLAAQMGNKTEMSVINQEEYYHPQLKSDSSWKAQSEQQTMKKTQQNETQHIQRAKGKQLRNNVTRKSQLLPIVSVQIDQNGEAGLTNGQMSRENNQKRIVRNHQRKPTNLETYWLTKSYPDNNSFSGKIMENKMESEGTSRVNESIIEPKENKANQTVKDQANLQHIKNVQNKKENLNLAESKQQLTQSSFKKQHIITQLQHQSLQESHLAPISENYRIQRFSKLNVRKSKIQNLANHFKTKFMHSTDYLDKYVKNEAQFSQKKLPAFKENVSLQSNVFNKNSLIIINNRHKTAIENSKATQKQQFYSVKQTKSPKSKVKLINLSKLNHENPLKKLNQQGIRKIITQNNKSIESVPTKSLNQHEYLYHSSTKESLNESCIKLQKKDEQKPSKILMNQKIAESCHLVNSQSQYSLIAKQLRQKSKRQTIVQYLQLIQISHRKFCGQKCAHIENLYKKVNFDGSKLDENIIDQLLRLIKKGI